MHLNLYNSQTFRKWGCSCFGCENWGDGVIQLLLLKVCLVGWMPLGSHIDDKKWAIWSRRPCIILKAPTARPKRNGRIGVSKKPPLSRPETRTWLSRASSHVTVKKRWDEFGHRTQNFIAVFRGGSLAAKSKSPIWSSSTLHALVTWLSLWHWQGPRDWRRRLVRRVGFIHFNDSYDRYKHIKPYPPCPIELSGT
jgi:hypothetical protein